MGGIGSRPLPPCLELLLDGGPTLKCRKAGDCMGMTLTIPSFKEILGLFKANSPSADKRNFAFATGPFSEKQWREPTADRLETGEEAMLNLICLYMCVQIRQEAIASVRLKLMQKQKNAAAVEITDHELLLLLAV